MGGRSGTFCAACVILLILNLAFLPPIAWLALKATDESSIQCAIQEFYINTSSLNQSFIYFDLVLTNDAQSTEAYYDNLNLTFSYLPDGNPNPKSMSIIPIANYTSPGFHQDVDEEIHRSDFLLSLDFPWKDNASSSSKVVLRVDLVSAVRFEDYWMGNKFNLMAWAVVDVNRATGKKVNKKAITLKSIRDKHSSQWWWACVGLNLLGILFAVFNCFSVIGLKAISTMG